MLAGLPPRRLVPEKKIIVTGANSYLGSAVVRYLIDKTNWHICGLVSPRTTSAHSNIKAERVRYIRADLTQSLSEEIRRELESADRVVHFAWVRGKRLEQVIGLNCTMINSLGKAMATPSGFCLISSVAACPRALSIYGQAKYRAMQLVSEFGGISLVCGLVVDEVPRGPFRLLTCCIGKLPLSIRFTKGAPQVYPIHIRDVGLAVQRIGESNLGIGGYKMFGPETDLNAFLRMLEDIYRRKRIPVRVDAQFILGVISFLKRVRLVPAGLADKVLTFLHKEAEYLMSHKDIPGISYRPISEATFHRA
jgi:nucleoside-diphosphate-sugar epimerase